MLVCCTEVHTKNASHISERKTVGTFAPAPRLAARRLAMFFALILAASSAACSRSDAPASAAPSPAPDASARPATGAARVELPASVVIGASVSDGFDSVDASVPAPSPQPGAPVDPAALIPGMGGGAARIRLAEIIAAVTNRPKELDAIHSYTSSLYFMNPQGIAEQQLKAAQARTPALIFAIDYLFWQSYGIMPDDKRPAALTRGLERLDRLLGPAPTSPIPLGGPTPNEPVIVIADLPDMSHAVGKMLLPAQMPGKDALAALNTTLAEWARARPRVVMVSLSATVAGAMSSGTVTLGGVTLVGKDARNLLTWDGLHATPAGLIALTSEALRQLKERGVISKDAAWTTDPAIILNRVTDARAATPAPAEPAPAP